MNEIVIDKAYIEHRVEDWITRVTALYSQVKNTLINYQDLEFLENRTILMHEELMVNHDVRSVKIPILDIRKNKILIASFKPVGLWVIGARGRIDILTNTGVFILVDASDREDSTNWIAYTPENRKMGKVFNSDFIHSLVIKNEYFR